MIRTVTLLCLLAAVSCQYPRQRAPTMRDPQPYYDDEEPQDDYRPQAPPRVQPPPARRSSTLLRPASVHYVNIGQELAGDYKFGYDTGKGEDGQSFREETRLPDGSVQGAYGYVDDTGVQRIVKYIAGKDGFKVLKDGEAADKPAAQPARRAPVQSAPPAQPAYRAPVQPAPPAQPAYRAPVQSAPPAQPAYRSAPPAQPAYRAPVQSAPPAQPAYRSAPPAQPAYRAPVQSAPPAQPAYRAPAQPAYRAPPAPQRSYEPEPRPNRRQYVAPKRSQDDEYDYDYPENEIRERRLVPVDTTLFNYNIGTQQGNRE